MGYIWNPKTKKSGVITCIPQEGDCPVGCDDCFFQSGRSYLEPHESNLPNIPAVGITEGYVVRMNDGNDSNNQRSLVEEVAKRYDEVFFNTSIIQDLGKFERPVVLTVNPSFMTDKEFHKINQIPDNLMFVRFRVNTWNLKLLDEAIHYYVFMRQTPVVLTYMAYYNETVPDDHKKHYTWKQRTLNSYYVMKRDKQLDIEYNYIDNPLVYTCGYKGTYDCSRCGNCLREYFVTKVRMKK